MYSLEHSVSLTDVRRTRGSYSALELRRLVGQDIAVEVGQNHYLELRPSLRIYQLSGHYVDIPVVELYSGVILRDLLRGV